MALMLGQLYDALRTGNVRENKARAANDEGEIGKRRLEVGEVKSDVSLRKWMAGFAIALVLGACALQGQILLRLPS